eukprot:5024593-Prymnesium_polylepis.1
MVANAVVAAHAAQPASAAEPEARQGGGSPALLAALVREYDSRDRTGYRVISDHHASWSSL